jgi:catechol 2,3-dioxygenase
MTRNTEAPFAIRRAGHVVLGVTDLDRAKRFLEDVFSLQTTGNAGPFFFLTGNAVSNHHMIGVRAYPGTEPMRLPDPARQIGMVSISYEVVGFDDLRRLYGRVQRRGPAYGARVIEQRRRGTMSTFVCADADGNWFEFYCHDDRLAAETQDAADGPVRIRGTGFLTLRVMDFERSRAFYEDFLEMVPFGTDADGRYYLAGKPGAHGPQLALEAAADRNVPMPTPRAMYGMDHFALELGSFEELQRAYRRFRDTATPIHHTVDHGVTLSLYFNDPDGNLMEVYHDVPRADYADPASPFIRPAPLEERLAVPLRNPTSTS